MQIIRTKNPQISVEKDQIGFLSIWKKEKENPFVEVLLLEENKKMIGYLIYAHIYDRIEIEQFQVLKEKRGKGYGKQLLRKLLFLAKEENIQNITLEVKKDNLIALSLYKSLGFQEKAIRKKYYQGQDGILMEYRLID